MLCFNFRRARIPFYIEKQIQFYTPVLFSVLGIPKGALINLVVCCEKDICELNFYYLRKNTPTDVLSWKNDLPFFYEQDKKFAFEIPFGEIAICHEICLKQSKQYKWAYEVEFSRLLVHGLTHIAGYDHTEKYGEKKMLTVEIMLLDYLGFPLVYR